MLVKYLVTITVRLSLTSAGKEGTQRQLILESTSLPQNILQGLHSLN